jgi:hypothetical protein
MEDEAAAAAGAAVVLATGAPTANPELKLTEPGAAVCACKPAHKVMASAPSVACRLSDFENDFNMGNGGIGLKS